jgi:hypothetical protein
MLKAGWGRAGSAAADGRRAAQAATTRSQRRHELFKSPLRRGKAGRFKSPLRRGKAGASCFSNGPGRWHQPGVAGLLHWRHPGVTVGGFVS